MRHGVQRRQLHRPVESRAVGADDDALDARRDCDDAAADKYVPVDTLGLFLSTVKIALAPSVISVILNRYTPRFEKFILPVSPLISVLIITLICASIIGSLLAGIWRLQNLFACVGDFSHILRA
jgi:hypothetical protein